MSTISLTQNAKKRIIDITNNNNQPNKFLRITIIGGGCSGFQYKFSLDDKIDDKDITIEEDNKIYLATDQNSLEFIKESEIDFIEELGGSFFKVNNPNSTANCGCGAS
ncbi:iron-sulfur cluster assembly accessory protein, partial [Rickettsiales bacterium]|nr:iron-sulfur cluster assembly accessory protein [Rickettsiales bacterium]